MYEFISSLNTKEDILKNVDNLTVSGPIDFHCMDTNTM